MQYEYDVMSLKRSRRPQISRVAFPFRLDVGHIGTVYLYKDKQGNLNAFELIDVERNFSCGKAYITVVSRRCKQGLPRVKVVKY